MLRECTRRRLALAGLLASLLFLVALIPHHAGVVGFNSNRNEATTMGVLILLNWQNPYHWRDTLGMPISQLAGELLSAAPAVALTGNAAWNLPLWWCLWLLVLAYVARNGQRALTAIGLLALATSPCFAYQALLGEDLLWTGLQAAVALTLFITFVSDGEVRAARKVLFSVFLGVSLASRLSWALAFLPLMTIPDARRWWLIGLATWMAMVLPFWLLSNEFGPLINPTPAVSTEKRVAVVFAAAVAAMVLARYRARTLPRILGEVALVQFGLVIAATVLNSVSFGRLHLGTLGYAMFAQGCAVGGIVAALVGSPERVRNVPA
jgi:uncharacterized membrane protein